PRSPLLDLWQPPLAPLSIAAWLALGAVGVLAWWTARRSRPYLLPISLFFLPLVPVAAASLVESGARFAERALALPVAGLALGAATLAWRQPADRRRVAAAAIVA